MSEDNYAVVIKNVRKSFKVYSDKITSLKELFVRNNGKRHEKRVVLNSVSFNIKKGEAVGIIGENGCGKSTLLKLMTRIEYPDSGSIDISGKVSALIELGAGFHPDMSGRENIYINASIFGLTKKEIDSRLEQIIEFSELGEYIDNPVRTYSSGMYMRLAFSVAINVGADILLIDEILSVGDASFQSKCFNKLREIKKSGTTIIIVSHALSQIEQLCDRSIWICDGRIRQDGIPRTIHPAYLEYMGGKQKEKKPAEDNAADAADSGTQPEDPAAEGSPPQTQEQAAAGDGSRWGSRDIVIDRVELLDSSGKPSRNFRCGSAMSIAIRYTVRNRVDSTAFGIGIFRNDGIHCYGSNTQIDHVEDMRVYDRGETVCVIDENTLLPGDYTIDAAVHSEDGFAYDYWCGAASFSVFSDVQDIGVSRLKHEWVFKDPKEQV